MEDNSVELNKSGGLMLAGGEETKKVLTLQDFTIKERANGKLRLGGYMSTPDVDYANDVCPAPDCWKELLPIFLNNPIYCLNHHQEMPIGACNNVYADAGGLMFDDVELAEDDPYIANVIVPRIRIGALKQQSVGFYSLDKTTDPKTGVTYHNRNLITEGSLVSVAMNRFCYTEIKTLNGPKDYEDLTQMYRDYLAGQITDTKITEMHKAHYVPSNYDDVVKKDKSDDTDQNRVPEMPTNNIVATKHDASRMDADGKPVERPTRKSSDYNAVSEALYAGYREKGEGERSYLHQIAVPTEGGGYAYDKDMIAVAVCRVLGARDGSRLESSEKAALVKRLGEAYDALGTDFPVYHRGEQSLAEMKDWKLADVEFSEVSFKNGEDETFKRVQLETDLKNVGNAIKSYDGKVPESVAKYIGASISLELYASLYDKDESDLLVSLIQQIIDFKHKDDDESGDAMYLGFAKFLEGSDTRYVKVLSKDDGKARVQLHEADEEGKFVAQDVFFNDIHEAELKEIGNLGKLNLLVEMRGRIENEAKSILDTLSPIETKIELSQSARKFLDIFLD